MKDNIISVNLETATAPIIKEVRGRDYIEYGTDDWRNLYPQFLIDLYYNSSTHAAIINGTAEMIAGEELVIEDDDTNLDVYVKLKKCLLFMRILLEKLENIKYYLTDGFLIMNIVYG